MRAITKIARQELSLLFNSPVAWLILIVFPVQIGIDYVYYIQMVGRSQRMGHHFNDVTALVFTGKEGFFMNVKNTLYFYIPLLTMGLISRETHSGSIKLLLSSPIKIRDIIIGKYLAMLGYGLLLLLIIVMYCISGSFFIRHIDWTLLVSGSLGLYLLIAAYSAIGLFMSSLTTYQVVAAISTLAILAGLNFVGGLFQGNDAVRHITYFMSIAGRTEQMIRGLISTEDVLYFVLVVAFFLAIAGMRLLDQREARPLKFRIARYTALACGLFLAGYISSRPALTGYVDMTATNRHTLGPQSKALVKQMNQPLVITTYANILDQNFYLAPPEKKSEDEKLFIPYRRFLPSLQMKYVYYYDFGDNKELYKKYPGESSEAIARKVADIQDISFKRVLTPEQVRKLANLAPEENRLVRELQYGNKKTFVRYFDDFMIYAGEPEITAALKRLLTPGEIPLITFVTGNGERSTDRKGDADYRKFARELSFRAALVNQGFDVDTVNLDRQELAPATAVLVLAAPKTALSATAVAKLQQYIQSGRNLFVLTEPGSNAATAPVLQELGVKADEQPVTEPSKDYAPDFIMAHFAEGAGAIEPRFSALQADSAIVSVPGAAALQQVNASVFHATPLLVTQNKQPLVMALERKQSGRQQRIIVSGDADFISTAELSRSRPEVRNQLMTTSLFRWFTNGAFPVNTGSIPSKDAIESDDTGVLALRIVFFGVLPLALLVFATSLLMYRKRR